MIRGTTPNYVLTIDGYDLSDKTVFVTIRQGQAQVTKTGEQLSVVADESGSTIAFMLTQQDTFVLSDGNAEIQVRFIDSAGTAYATEIASIVVGRVLYERVIAHG